eukprot:12977749-Ditylum_brightwellii.AAC.1
MSNERSTSSEEKDAAKDYSESLAILLPKPSSSTVSFELKDAPPSPSRLEHRKYVFVHDKVYSWLPAKVVSSSSDSASAITSDDANATVT